MSDAGAAGIRDVVDFHLRWAEFRPIAQAASQSVGLAQDQRQILSWLIQLADRVGELDVVPRPDATARGAGRSPSKI